MAMMLRNWQSIEHWNKKNGNIKENIKSLKYKLTNYQSKWQLKVFSILFQ